MRHFDHVAEAQRAQLFSRRPEAFSRTSPPEVLAMALGATLYMPATRPNLADDLARQSSKGVLSSVVCLEDAVADADVEMAQDNSIAQLRLYSERLAQNPDTADTDGPLVFVRVRRPDQISEIVAGLGEHARVLTGFVMPKFTDLTGPAYLHTLTQTAEASGLRLLAMPVIESPEVIYRETRQETLLGISRLLEKYRESVLCVRIGATDLCSPYGIRRDRDLTIYDVRLVAEVISDIVNVLGRADGSGYVITGPVWEYFPDHERLFKTQLRQSPFESEEAERLRREIILGQLDGLIREVVLDKANGLVGKTAIHPSHAATVHALSVVTHEEYGDASDIVRSSQRGGGVDASSYRNKMNESKPHLAWAERILQRASVFGVAAEDVSFVDLLAAGTGT